MGYYFSRYGFFKTLQKEENKEKIKEAFKEIKLYAFVLYNPKTNDDFKKHFEIDFKELNISTGNNFLFFSMIKNPSKFVNEEIIQKINNLQLVDENKEINDSENEDITAYSIANCFKIRFEDLPI